MPTVLLCLVICRSTAVAAFAAVPAAMVEPATSPRRGSSLCDEPVHKLSRLVVDLRGARKQKSEEGKRKKTSAAATTRKKTTKVRERIRMRRAVVLYRSSHIIPRNDTRNRGIYDRHHPAAVGTTVDYSSYYEPTRSPHA